MITLRTAAERSRWFQFVEGLGLPADVEAKKHKPTRSSKQNRYLFGGVYPPIAEAMGYEVDGDNGIHAFMCGTHFGWVDKKCPKTPRNPEGIESVPFRTTTRNEHGKRSVLPKDEFTKFVRTVERIAAKAGVYINERWES